MYGALEDNFVYSEIKKLVSDKSIKKIIETGTFHGKSSILFASLGVDTYTIESSSEFYEIAKKNIEESGYKNINLIFGNSPEILNNLITENEENILLFLDAHWYDYWPIHDELKVCINKKIKPVIIIHDFYVPDENGNPKFGYDKYNEQSLDLEYIKKYIIDIYGDNNFIYYYNTEVDKVGQGVIYITEKI